MVSNLSPEGVPPTFGAVSPFESIEPTVFVTSSYLFDGTDQ